MSPDERAHFVSAYTEILLAAWSSRSYAELLDSDPRLALAQFGLVVEDDASIEVRQEISAEHGPADLEVAVADWSDGRRTGHYRLYVPSTPQLDVAELDLDDLEALSAGYSANQCCCTPCCSCG